MFRKIREKSQKVRKLYDFRYFFLNRGCVLCQDIGKMSWIFFFSNVFHVVSKKYNPALSIFEKNISAHPAGHLI